MRLISTICLSGALTLGIAAAAMAQDTTAQPAGQAAGPHGGPPGGGPGGPGGFRGGAGAARPVHPPAAGGAYGVISAVTAKGFTVLAPGTQTVAVELAPGTTYRMGKATASARAIKVGDRVRVLGPVAFGAPMVITATQVVLQPVDGAGSETSLKVAEAVVAVLKPVANGGPGGQAPREGGQGPGAGGAGPPGARPGLDLTRQGLPVPARHIGNLNPDWGDAADSRTTIAAGADAYRATEVGMAAPYSAGGIVDRVVKEPDGTYLVHNIGTSWPHHIFVSANFELIGAAN
jgi:hypothetical protein